MLPDCGFVGLFQPKGMKSGPKHHRTSFEDKISSDKVSSHPGQFKTKHAHLVGHAATQSGNTTGVGVLQAAETKTSSDQSTCKMDTVVR